MKDITDMEKDRQYMKMALELAQKGMGFTAPNPMVGAVIVKRGKVIGQGYHRKGQDCGNGHRTIYQDSQTDVSPVHRA